MSISKQYSADPQVTNIWDELPSIENVSLLKSGVNRLYISAYGFEQRSTAWLLSQKSNSSVIFRALLCKYVNPKGENKIETTRSILRKIGIERLDEIEFDVTQPYGFEDDFESILRESIIDCDEIIVDITSMTKLMILVCLYKLSKYSKIVRIIYTEALSYAPSENQFRKSIKRMEMFAKFPSRGVESIIRMKCLSSVRMQGQPITMVAFTSFNEQLVRHILGTISPHRMIFIAGRPHRSEYAWRERAAQDIHRRLIDAYIADNILNEDGSLKLFASTFEYKETIQIIDKIYQEYGTYERIICAATGSKMQTLGLYLSKMMHPDLHIEYPAPDSYFVKGISRGIRQIYQIVFKNFMNEIELLRNHTSCLHLPNIELK
jgi:hypothetical protein